MTTADGEKRNKQQIDARHPDTLHSAFEGGRLHAEKLAFLRSVFHPFQTIGTKAVEDTHLFAHIRDMQLPRVFFDTNGETDGGYWLGFSKSLEDLEALGDALRPGTVVTIYMPDDLEMTATLRFDEEANVWIAVPFLGTIKYLDGSE